MAECIANHGSFTDQRLFMVRVDGDQVGMFTPESEINLQQECDGPRFLVIGRFADEGRIERWGRKLGIDPKVIFAFRDGDQDQEEVVSA